MPAAQPPSSVVVVVEGLCLPFDSCGGLGLGLGSVGGSRDVRFLEGFGFVVVAGGLKGAFDLERGLSFSGAVGWIMSASG